jgi:hypothetical protein
MYSYCVCGLSVASDIDLPGLIRVPSAQAPAEVSIRCAAVPVALEEASVKGATWQTAGHVVLLRIPGIARFLMRCGSEIIYAPEDSTPSHDVAIFIIGTVFAILLHQRGGIVLRASAVGVGDRAVLFCGPAGVGKSVMAAALEQRGYPLLSDDLCLLGVDGAGAPVVHSDGRGLTLWADAIGHLDLVGRQGPAVRANFAKHYIEPRATAARSLPLGAVYVLRTARLPLENLVESPRPVDAVLLVQRSAYHPRLVAALRHKPRFFLSAAGLCGQAGVFLLSQPRDLSGMASRIDRLVDHWRMNGLCGARS